MRMSTSSSRRRCGGDRGMPSGTPLRFAPKWKGYAGQRVYRVRTGVAVTCSWGAGDRTSAASCPVLGGCGAAPAGDDRGLWAGQSVVGLATPDDRYSLTLQVRNLFDQSFAASIHQWRAGAGVLATRFPVMRTGISG